MAITTPTSTSDGHPAVERQGRTFGLPLSAVRSAITSFDMH